MPCIDMRTLFFSLAFIGHTDSVICTFDELVDVSDGGCSWQLEGGVITVAENVEPPLPTVDAGSNPEGIYRCLSEMAETKKS